MSQKREGWWRRQFGDVLHDELGWVTQVHYELDGEPLVGYYAYTDDKLGKRVYTIVDLVTDVIVYQGCSVWKQERARLQLMEEYERFVRYQAKFGVKVQRRAVVASAPVVDQKVKKTEESGRTIKRKRQSRLVKQDAR